MLETSTRLLELLSTDKRLEPRASDVTAYVARARSAP
jgi:hypothetical protein